jgi:thiol-disulfide isomerase/thioredoxin
MKNYVCLISMLCSSFFLFAQDVEVIKYDKLEDIIKSGAADIQVVNFWATWCKPCIQEIPYFEEISEKYSHNQVKVLLVSLDFVEELNTKVMPFVKKRGLKSEVKLLDETDFNTIINEIDASWSGAIPATLVINNKSGQSYFYEKMFKEGELEFVIQDQLNK